MDRSRARSQVSSLDEQFRSGGAVFHSEARRPRFAAFRLEGTFPHLPQRPGYNKPLDKGFASKSFEKELAERGVELLRPSRTCEKRRHGEPMPKKVRQLIESVNDPFKGRLDLEHHGGRTFEGVAVRVAQRVLATAAAIWRDHQTGAPITRSLIVYDH